MDKVSPQTKLKVHSNWSRSMSVKCGPGICEFDSELQGRINHLVGPTHSTTPGPRWKARRTPKRERGAGRVVPSPINWSGERCISSSAVSGAKPRQKTDLVKFEIENTPLTIRITENWRRPL